MKKGLKVLLVLMVVSLSFLVLAAQFNQPFVDNVSPARFSNQTGSINLNLTIRQNTTTLNHSIINVTFAWFNMSGHRLHNTTIFNTTNAQVSFQNGSFDTSLLPDGKYNITVTAYNLTGGSVSNATLTFNITIDNTAPVVNVSNLGVSGNPEIQYGRNFSVTANVTFNVTAYDFRPGQTKSTDTDDQFELSSVYFWFDNGTGNDFNRTAVNSSGQWSLYLNMSSLNNGNEFQTVRVMANDSMSNGTRNNLNNSVFWNFTADGTAPVVTASSSGVTATAATLTATINESTNNCTYSVTNGAGSGTMTKSSPTSFTATVVLLASNDYVASLTCQDFAGNINTNTTSFSSSAAAAAASSGGSGSGGSSSGISTGVTGSFEKKVWASINAGETASVALNNGVLGVTELSFAVPNTVYGAWVIVSKREKLPSSAPALSGEVYRILEITKGPSLNKEGAFTDAIVKFKVEKAWLSEKKLTKEAVTLYRLDSKWSELTGKWNQLAATVGEDDGTYVHYSAKTPDFSYFVIGQDVGAVAAAPGAEAGSVEAPTEAEAAAEAAAMELKGSKTWLVGLLAALVVVVAVVVYMRRKK